MDASTLTTRSLKKNFAAALDLLADVALHPRFRPTEIERQRASRLAQLVQQRENPRRVARDDRGGVLYGAEHPYGYTELGTEASIEGDDTRDDLQAFWKQNFVPNNAALVVAGDITMAELRPLAEKAFGAWQRGHAGGAGARTPHDRPAQARHRRQAGRAADAAARGADRRRRAGRPTTRPLR